MNHEYPHIGLSVFLLLLRQQQSMYHLLINAYPVHPNLVLVVLLEDLWIKPQGLDLKSEQEQVWVS